MANWFGSGRLAALEQRLADTEAEQVALSKGQIELVRSVEILRDTMDRAHAELHKELDAVGQRIAGEQKRAGGEVKRLEALRLHIVRLERQMMLELDKIGEAIAEELRVPQDMGRA